MRWSHELAVAFCCLQMIVKGWPSDRPRLTLYVAITTTGDFFRRKKLIAPLLANTICSCIFLTQFFNVKQYAQIVVVLANRQFLHRMDFVCYTHYAMGCKHWPILGSQKCWLLSKSPYWRVQRIYV